MFKVTGKIWIILEGCPATGIAAIDWWRVVGLVEEPTNEVRVVIDLVDEDLVRECGGGDEGADLALGQSEYPGYDWDRRPANARAEDGKCARHVIPLDVYQAGEAAIVRFVWARYQTDLAVHESAKAEQRERDADKFFETHEVAIQFGCLSMRPGYIDADDPRWIALRERTLRVLADREREKEEAERVAAEAAAARSEFLREWIAQHGTEGQIARQAEGLLSEDEAIKSLRDDVFAPLSDRERYKRITRSDFCLCDCYEAEACVFSVEVEDAKTLTDHQYGQLLSIRSAIRSAYPSAAVIARRHVATTDECDQRFERFSALVNVTLGPVSVSREYAL